MASIRAIYENGKLRLLDPVELQEGQEVKITIVQKEVTTQTNYGKRKLELFQDEIWMSEDFDKPLPDSFWLGDDA
jgi:predicted DNA-binding antitoxin AbrB/MazE fold protein